MKKLIQFIFILFICFSENTFAQAPKHHFWGLNHNKTVLDRIKSTNASMAYSVRKLRRLYTGFAMRVRKGTGTSLATADVAFNATNGVVDANSVVTIVTAGTASGHTVGSKVKFGTFYNASSVYVITWYDQSGNARHVTQATEAKQPRIVNAGTLQLSNGKTSIYFGGASATILQITVAPSVVFGSGYIGTAAVVLERSDGNTIAFGYSPNSSGRWQCHINWNTKFYFDVGFDKYGRIVAVNPYTGLGTYMMIANSTAPQMRIFIDGVLAIADTSNSPSPLPASTTVFNIGGIDYFHTGHQSELIFFPAALADNEIEIIQRNQKTFYKTP